MYKCGICGSLSRPGQPRFVHVVHRLVKSIRWIAGVKSESQRSTVAEEIPVCGSCKSALANGVNLNDLRGRHPAKHSSPSVVSPTPPDKPTSSAPPVSFNNTVSFGEEM